MDGEIEPTSEQKTVTFYELVGGEDGLRRLISRFYEIMDSEPTAAGIRAMHAPDLGSAREKLIAFMSGWLGGPRLYMGCVMGAHRRFEIGEAERDQWLECMRRALNESDMSPNVRKLLETPLFSIADAMRSH